MNVVMTVCFALVIVSVFIVLTRVEKGPSMLDRAVAMDVVTAALIQGARGTVVYTVEDGKAVSKPVQQVFAQGLDAAVTGIAAGDVVVLDGKQNLRPGSRVVERAAGPHKSASAPAGASSKSAAP